VVRATHTVSFGPPKLAFLLPQNAGYVGEWHLEDIRLSRSFIEQAESPWHYTAFPQAPPADWPPAPAAQPEIQLPRRNKFAYKNTFGHALLLAGSRGKVGAAVLASGSCLRSGVGLLTVAVPGCGYDIIQTTRPEAMCLADDQPDFISELPGLKPYQAVAIGPGLGQNEASRAVLEKLLRETKVPLVLDADALNLLGEHRELLALLPENTVLTPHIGEFTRLTEKARDDYHRLDLLREFARQHRCIVVLKGAYTATAAPDGQVYFNGTGNPGMGTGGSGDVLTGIVLALRADQRLAPLLATRLAVLAHGHAGDLAATETGEAGLVAGDLVAHIGPALRALESAK
jgi:NAD(P)H-hydrate epimerase